MSSDESRRLLLELLGEGGTQLELPRSGVLTIGAMASKVGFHVSGQGVSDVHCAIGRAKGGGFALKDLGSEYGTWVNGERVTQAKLEVGDSILIGSRRLRVFDPSAPPPKSAAAQTPSPAAAPAPANAPTPQAPAARLTPVATTNYEQSPLPKIPGYRIEKLLGRGGMGEVFLATQERLDRKVALKLLSQKLCADADFVRRFQDEARAAAALSHPNVVVVHDVGEESGRHYLSMEFMDKGNLEGVVARGGRMPWRDVLGVLHDIAGALVYAEARGIVHRDIKPANLMQGSAGATKLADLGLATQIEAESSDSENGRIFGTPHFISPEQARGERVDGRADLYSLGATAYRLLSGRTPFEGATTRDILRGHFNDTPRPLLEIDAQIPPEIVRIVERLLQKKPDDRFPSASVLLAEVDRVRSSLLHGERKAGATRGMPKLVVVALLIAAAGAAWWFSRDLPGKGEPSRNGNNPALAQGPGNADAQPPDEIGGPTDTNTEPPRNEDDDTKLKLLETSAKLAWKEVPNDLAPADRAARLLALSVEYEGTGAAVDMRAEAEAITLSLQQADAAVAELSQRRLAALSSLAGASKPFLDSPAAAFAAMNALAFDTQLLADESFTKERLAHYRKVLAEGLAAATRANSEISASAARGDFADVSVRIEALGPRLAAPPLPEGILAEQLPDLALLAALARDLSERGGGIDAERAQFLAAQVGADRARLATGLCGADAFESELRALEFAALGARLAKLEGELATEPARNFVHDLGADLRLGQAALNSLARELGTGGWKRKQVADPRGGRALTRNALAADELGLTLEIDGRPEAVPWSAFGGRPRELHLLFNERLDRAYTREELLGIEALLRTAAIAAAIEGASEMLEPGTTARFDESELRELGEGFEWGRGWANQAGVAERYEAESKAAALLGRSLFDASEGSWSASVAGLDRLLKDHADTLLVRLISNGGAAH